MRGVGSVCHCPVVCYVPPMTGQRLTRLTGRLTLFAGLCRLSVETDIRLGEKTMISELGSKQQLGDAAD